MRYRDLRREAITEYIRNHESAKEDMVRELTIIPITAVFMCFVFPVMTVVLGAALIHIMELMGYEPTSNAYSAIGALAIGSMVLAVYSGLGRYKDYKRILEAV